MNRLQNIAKNLRKGLTDAEKLLWKYLRARQLEGFKFRRQEPTDNYIVDFICFENRLIIEVDGGQHVEEKEKDIERDNYLRKYGFKVLRFWNNEVLTNIEGVLEVIREELSKSPSPNPSRQGRRNFDEIAVKGGDVMREYPSKKIMKNPSKKECSLTICRREVGERGVFRQND